MSSPQPNKPHNNHQGFIHNLDTSAILTVIGIILLFSGAIIVTLLAPRYVDPTWTSPSSSYQVQMYEISDPNLYISSSTDGNSSLQFIHHLKDKETLLAFHETKTLRIVAPPSLTKFITHNDDPNLKLTSHLMLLRKPQKTKEFDAIAAANELLETAKKEWEKTNSENKESTNKEKKNIRPTFVVLELYEPGTSNVFSVASSEGNVENWVDKNFTIIDDTLQHPYHSELGVIYVNNPVEYRYSSFTFNNTTGWRYDPDGKPIKNIEELKSHALGFRSRAELISLGEHIYAIEGCWYCHTDQTRTLVQDVVLNGSDSYPAPPSSANEYIYQQITFPGTRRIGPDLSRVGIKRPSRDWHKGHFWSPKTASKGSIMPAFRHFFDDDPRGTAKSNVGIPNYKFEAVYQYLMTKGTRITPPTYAWWQGKDPLQTKRIIEGKKEIAP